MDGDEVARRVSRAWRELRRGASMTVLREQFLGTGDDALEPGQMDTLDVLVAGDTWRMSDLAEALRVDPSTATRAVERLTRIDLAERLPDPLDRRVVLVRATAAGRARYARASVRWQQVVHDILDELEPDERGPLAASLERLVAALDRVVAGSGPATPPGSVTPSAAPAAPVTSTTSAPPVAAPAPPDGTAPAAHADSRR